MGRSKKSPQTCLCCKKSNLIRLNQHLENNIFCENYYKSLELESNTNPGGLTSLNIHDKRRSLRLSSHNKSSKTPTIHIGQSCNTDTDAHDIPNSNQCHSTIHEENNTEGSSATVFQNSDSNEFVLDMNDTDSTLIQPLINSILPSSSSLNSSQSNHNISFGSHNFLLNSTTNIDSFPNNQEPYDFSFVSERMCMHQANITYSKKQLVSLKLYDILRRIDAPICAYQELRQFLNAAIPKLIDEQKPYLESRTKLIQDMHSQIFSGDTIRKRKRQLSKNCKRKIDQQTTQAASKHLYHETINNYNFQLGHKNVPVMLKDCNEKIHVPVFDFISQVASLLQDPFLMKFSNTRYHHKTYSDPIEHPTVNYDDLESSDWFKNAHHNMIKNKSNELVVPIILFVDGVPIDSFGRKSLEPVMFTIGIFKRAIRNLSSAWRVLGFIPNVEKVTKHTYKNGESGSTQKKLHYHQMLKAILDEISNIQQRGGMKWNLRYPGRDTFKTVTLKFVISFIIGDCLGNDKLCSRIQNYVPTKLMNTGVCRDCNITYKHCCKHNFKCNPISRDLLKSIPESVLNQLSFYDVGLNCFDFISFGGDENGINGSSPPEPLHQWYLGVVKFLVEYFLGNITPKSKEYLDLTIKELSRTESRQSERSMPSLDPFKVGIDKVKLTGTQKGSQLFMIYLAMISPKIKEKLVTIEISSGNKFTIRKETKEDGSISRKRIIYPKLIGTTAKYNRWIRIFEDMISIGEWMSASKSSITKQSLEETEEVYLYMVDDFKSLLIPKKSHVHDARLSNKQESSLMNNIDDSIFGIEVNEENTSLEDQDDIHFAGRNDDDIVDSLFECEDGTKDAQYIVPENNSSDDISDDEDMLDSMLNLPIVRKKCRISKTEYGIRLFMKNVKRAMHTCHHHRLKTVKFHQLLHLVWYVKKYGSLSNIDGGIPERILKDKAKHPGKHTQQRNETINSQTSTRVTEDQIISQAITIAFESNQYSEKNGWDEYFIEEVIKETYGSLQQSTDRSDNDISNTSRQDVVSVSGCSRFKFSMGVRPKSGRQHGIQVDNIDIVFKKKYMIQGISKEQQQHRMKIIVQSLVDRLQLDVKKLTLSRSIYMYNYLKMDNNIYHASFQAQGDKNWFDWCNVLWDSVGNCPAKIIAFVDGALLLENLSRDNINASDPPNGSVWAVIQSTHQQTTRNVFTSQLSTMWSMESNILTTRNNNVHYRLISIEDITGPCFVIQNKEYANMKSHNHTTKKDSCSSTTAFTSSSSIIAMHPRSTWSQLFINRCNHANL